MSNPQPQPTPAVGFLVMAFTNETGADEALKAMKEAKSQGQFYFEDAAVVRQDAEGKVHYQETGDMKTGHGAGAGAIVGGILGLLGGPAGIALGASAGAAIGALASHGDAGFKDESLNTIGVALKPGTSALTAITSHAFLRAFQKQVSPEEIRTLVGNLANEISGKLAEGKSLALGILFSEEAFVVKELAVGKDSAEVVGMAITNEAVVAGAAVITKEGMGYEVGVATAEGALVEQGVVTEEGAVIADTVILPQALPEREPAAGTKPEAPAGEAAAEEPKTE